MELYRNSFEVPAVYFLLIKNDFFSQCFFFLFLSLNSESQYRFNFISELTVYERLLESPCIFPWPHQALRQLDRNDLNSGRILRALIKANTNSLWYATASYLICENTPWKLRIKNIYPSKNATFLLFPSEFSHKGHHTASTALPP